MGRRRIRFEKSKCYICERELELEMFTKDKSRSTGVSSSCKECMVEKNRVRRQKRKRELEEMERIEN